MTQIAEEILKSFQELPAEEQCEVVDQLCESLWKTKLKSADAEDWQTFLEERIAAADRGDFAPGSAFDVIEEIRQELRQSRQ
jgi:hypothetical protein